MKTAKYYVASSVSHLSSKQRFIRIVECVSRLLSGDGQYSHTKKRNIAAAKEGVKKKFSIEFAMWSEHWSFSFYQAQLSKNP